MVRHERVPVHAMPMGSLLHLVNEWGGTPRQVAHGGTRPYAAVDTLRATDPAYWEGRDDPDEATLVVTANLLHPVFAASTGAECAERITALLAEARMTPAVAADGWRMRAVWHTARRDRGLLAAATLTLIDQLGDEPDARRLGTCAGDACADAYVDESPGGRRQYCCVTCQNRARARAYRASRRAVDAGPVR